jgi:glycosyltransferase involved in cell wall biosynthesis
MRHKPLFVLPTFNERKRIDHILKYYSTFGDVVVVDNFSSDGTVEVAAAHGAQILMKRNDGTVQTPEWNKWLRSKLGDVPIIGLSCSEFIPERTIHEIQNQLLDSLVAVVRVEAHTYTDGILLPLWGNKKRYIERGLHLGRLDMDSIRIHKPFEPLKNTKFCTVTLPAQHYVEHLRLTQFAAELIKVTNYARVEAAQFKQDGKLRPGTRCVKSMLREFFNLCKIKNIIFLKTTIPQIFLRIIMHIVIYYEQVAQTSKVENLYAKKYD